MFRKIAEVDQVPAGQGRAFEVAGRRIALFNVDGDFRAVESSCARHGAPLERGVVEGEVLHCPWHGVGFDLDTGVCSAFPDETSGTPLATKVEGDEVLVDL